MHIRGRTRVAPAVDPDRVLKGLLREAGFEPGLALIHRALRLDETERAEPITPADGYAIRSVEAADLERRVAVHPSRMTAERYARVIAAPTYRADLDVVAVATDGSLRGLLPGLV